MIRPESASSTWSSLSTLSILIVLSILCLSCSPGPITPERRFTLQDLSEDYQQLHRLIYNGHPMTFTDRDLLAQTFSDQRALLRDSMTVLEFYRVIAPAVSAVRCAHTELYLPESVEQYIRDSGHYFPLDLRLLGDTLFFLKSLGQETRLTPGDRITAINDLPTPVILSRLRGSLPADGTNQAKKDFLLNTDFATHYLTLIEDTGSFVIEYIGDSTRPAQTDTVASVPWTTIRGSEEHGNPITSRIVVDSGYAVLGIHFFGFYDDEDYFPARMDSFFNALAESDIQSLILDIRGNDGGDAYGAATLLGYLLDEPFPYFAPSSTFLLADLKDLQPVFDNRFRGSLYVLIDGGCYSTTGHFCAILKHHQRGTFIGTKTGGSLACNGGYKEITLKHTRIQLLLSHAVFIAAASSLTPGDAIQPDIPVQTSIADILEKHDPVIARAVALIDSLATSL